MARARRERPWRVLAPLRVLRARPHLIGGALFGIVIFYVTSDELTLVTRALIGWNAALLAYFVGVAMHIVGATHEDIRKRAEALDEGAGVMLLITTAVAIASFGAIVMELADAQKVEGVEKAVDIVLTIATVVSSWLFLHLTFALHYAHDYYRDDEQPDDVFTARRGLDFPQTEEPQYIDFLYYAYVIGVASQTGDVCTTSPGMRLVTMIHGVVAFFYNTTVLALMVNIASQLVK